MHRLITFLASVGIIAGLVACCCPMRFNAGGRRGGGPVAVAPQPAPDPGPIVQPPDVNPNNPPPPVAGDPTEEAIKKRGGMVKRDDAQPDRPIVEVRLNFTKTTDNDLMTLAPLTRLRKLTLSQNSDLTGVGLRDLAGLQNLEELDLNFCPINDEGMRHVAAFRNLKVLGLSGGKFGDAGFREIGKLDRLEELTASGMLMMGPGKNEPREGVFTELGKLKQLRKLDLANTHFGDECAKAIAGHSQLKILHVYGTNVTDIGMTELAKLKQLEELKVGYRITDKGVDALAGNNQLQVLSIWNSSGVGDPSVKTLSTLIGLRELDIGKTRIGAKGYVDLRKALPKCKITKK